MRALSSLTVAVTLAIASLLPAAGTASAAPAGVDAITRLEAARAAKTFWNSPTGMNPILPECTAFVSQSLWGGGMESTEDWNWNSSDQSKLASRRLMNPGPTKAAAAANNFVNYMSSSGRGSVSSIAWSDNTAGGAELADVIAYDWDDGKGGTSADGVIDHLAIVTGFTDDGYPLVTQRTPARLDRGWSWDPGSEDWIEYTHPGSRASLVHLN